MASKHFFSEEGRVLKCVIKRLISNEIIIIIKICEEGGGVVDFRSLCRICRTAYLDTKRKKRLAFLGFFGDVIYRRMHLSDKKSASIINRRGQSEG